ncbi:thioredoxin [Gordonia phage Emianna]|uniref:Thioredoxin n=2 Tax=Foxborovirus TaxID=2948710 RepID=A0A345L4Z1_9CAUD|nr:thioredoxin domain [Gordonia phage NatB6]YP_010098951.1 thioredoxin domain [Gordonia phage Emianna]AYD84335.1 thioredoxin [Gordonia phage Kurt]QOP66724.1 thioredoxin [Gordonia phage NovumRegina]QOR55905.1 thioredoxin [Gordonia phage GrootJr]AXH50343.1 thioredoxin [Gordonia phage NatB6]AYD83448.1 thioredoxin [Gordonia phage Emianna]
MPIIEFAPLNNPAIYERVTDESRSPRWLVLVGRPGDPMHDYLESAVNELPIYRNLRFASCDSWTGYDQVIRFLEDASLTSTPAILLVKAGHVETTITGTIPFDKLKEAVDQLCHSGAQDRMADAMAEIETAVPPQFEQVGVTADGRVLWAEKRD